MTNSLRWITLFIGILVLRPAAAAEPDLVKEALAHFAVRENSRLSHGWLSFSKDMGDVDWQQFEKLKGLKELKGLQLKTGSVTDKDLIHLEGFVGLESLALWDTQVSGSGFNTTAPIVLSSLSFCGRFWRRGYAAGDRRWCSRFVGGRSCGGGFSARLGSVGPGRGGFVPG